jgi:hypothetical protein
MGKKLSRQCESKLVLNRVVIPVHIVFTLAAKYWLERTAPKVGFDIDPEARQHLSAPGMLSVGSQRPKDPLGRFLFQLLHDEGRGFRRLRPEEQMKMFRHQHPADEQEI